MNALEVRSELAIHGIKVDAPVRRSGGAGPTGDCHISLNGVAAAVPTNPDSPYSVQDGRVFVNGMDVGIDVNLVDRPRFYDEKTSDGIEMHRIARLHGTNVLATTVVQTCVRYEPSQRCKYCSIEESLRSGATTRVKTPSQLAEVAVAAVQLDNVSNMVMTTGTAATGDRGSRYLARCVEAVKSEVPKLPIQIQCEPPDDLCLLEDLRTAGADSIGIHVESLDDVLRRIWLPGKATIPLERYWVAWKRAVEIFGWNQVSTYLLIGLGENSSDILDWAQKLISIGVFPFVVPVRPGTATLAAKAGLQDPNPSVVAEISAAVMELLYSAGMSATDQRAGCATCGACSTVSSGALGTSSSRPPVRLDQDA